MATRLDVQLLEGLVLLAEDLELLHAVGALAAEEEDDHDVLPLVVGERPGLAVGVGRGERLGRGGGPGQRAEGRQVDPVDGRLVGAVAVAGSGGGAEPALVGLPAGDDRLQATEDGQVAVGPSGERLELAIGVAGLLLLAGGLEDLDQGGQRRRPGWGSARRPSARCSRRSRSCGPPGGRGPGPRDASRSPWRTGRTPGRPRPGPGAGSLPARPGAVFA